MTARAPFLCRAGRVEDQSAESGTGEQAEYWLGACSQRWVVNSFVRMSRFYRAEIADLVGEKSGTLK